MLWGCLRQTARPSAPVSKRQRSGGDVFAFRQRDQRTLTDPNAPHIRLSTTKVTTQTTTNAARQAILVCRLNGSFR